jgi:pyruvate kinase
MTIGADSPLRFRRTKIVATLGPASSGEDTITRLVAAGVNVFRLNMSHGNHGDHRASYDRIRTVAKRTGQEVAVLADLCGPKIRVGLFEGGRISLIDGATVTVTTQQVLGKDGLIVSQYTALADDAMQGDRLLLDDGNIELLVQSVAGTEIECLVVHGGTLKDKKGMNLPGVRVSAPALTEKDRADALFACELGVDFIALSFVRKASDVAELRSLVEHAANPPLLIAKIEKPEALDVIEEILAVSDAIMVARGDLGVELDPARVPNVQEELVDFARAWRKPVIVATQMLESMITQSRPTRAEVTDVANAVRSGADAVMLSAETAAGAHPVDAVRTMDLVIRRTEDYMFAHGAFGSIEAYTPTQPTSAPANVDPTHDADAAIALAAANMSRELRTSAIVADASATHLLSILCAHRPAAMVIAFSAQRRARSLGCLTWGVKSVADSDNASEALANRAVGLLATFEREHLGGFVLVVTSEDGKRPSLSVLAG